MTRKKPSMDAWDDLKGGEPAATSGDRPAPPAVTPATGREKVTFSTYTTADVRARLRHLAIDEGRPVWEIVTEALEAYLKKHGR